MGHKLFMNPRAPSSALATLGALQPGALRFIKSLCPLVLVSNLLYVWYMRIILSMHNKVMAMTFDGQN